MSKNVGFFLCFHFLSCDARSFLFLLQWRNKLKGRIEHFQKPCSRSDEKRRLKARKQDKGGIHLSKSEKLKKTNKTDVLSLKHRWKIVKHSWRYVQSLDRSDELRWIDAFPIITLNCQDNQTFLKMLFQNVKLATICLSHIIWYVKYIFKLYWLIIYTLRDNLMNLKFPILISMNNIWYTCDYSHIYWISFFI